MSAQVFQYAGESSSGTSGVCVYVSTDTGTIWRRTVWDNRFSSSSYARRIARALKAAQGVAEAYNQGV